MTVDTPSDSAAARDAAAVQQSSRLILDLLQSQLGRIRRRFLVHGAGWLACAALGAAVVYYGLDRLLDLPGAIRVALTLVAFAWLAIAFRRRITYPLSRAFGANDVAIAIERRFPELRESLISAVQLEAPLRTSTPTERDRALRNQSAAMVAKLVDQAASEARQLPLGELLDAGRTLRVWGLAATFGVLGTVAIALDPAGAFVFLQRALGLSVPYPRLTHLVIELPDDGADFRVEQLGERSVRVTLPAGGDLPVLVRADGIVPREVSLSVEGGRGLPPSVAMNARAQGRFRYVFRRVNSAFRFYARGGDDDRGNLDVEVVTVRPPQVATIRADLEFPAYTRRPSETVTGGAVEALVGSRARLQVRATTAVATAALTFVESTRSIPLRIERVEDDGGAYDALVGEFVVETSDRYRVELTSADGLRNPHPGTYPVVALEDYAPVGRLLLPSNDDVNVVLPTARIPVRIDAGDDFGLVSVDAISTSARDEAEHRHALLALTPDEPIVERRVLTTVLDVAKLGADGAPLTAGDSVAISANLVDNRAPEPRTTDVPNVRVHVVGPADLARRIAGQFRRIRDEVERALELQEDRSNRLEEITNEHASGELTLAAARPRLVSVEVGQGRIVGAAGRIHRELMRAFNVHLFNGLEPSVHATKAETLFVSFHRQPAEQEIREAFLPGYYRLLSAERQAGRLGAMEKTLDPILTMIERADRIAVDLGPQAVATLEGANVAASDAAFRERLAATAETQRTITDELLRLRERLDEWNELQDLVFQTRSLRDRQKDVQARTRALQGGR